jgi:acyl carrier protein
MQAMNLNQPPDTSSETAHDTQVATYLAHFILTELARVPLRRLDPDLPLFESLLDSTSVMALVNHLEQHFAVEISDNEVVPANFTTLRRLTAFVERKRGANLHRAAGR